jgi:two-component system, NtrC family, response regulator HydG
MGDSMDRRRVGLEPGALRARLLRRLAAADETTLRGGHAELEGASCELELVVLQGPDEGARCLLGASHPSPLLVGQSATCDFRLADRSISRRHVAIDASSWPVRVRDLGSTNGTFVNGVAIVEAYLVGEETLRLGSTTLRTERRAASPRAPLPDRRRFGRTLGKSAAMRRLYPLCDQLAGSLEPLLIEGEPGTGKELLAESLHECGPRASAPFVVVDCALRARDLARRHRESGDAFEGAIAQAAGGSLLLDEIGELDAPLQRALARTLAGAPLEARVLVATRTDLDGLVQRGRFRDDLYAQISAQRIELPPLRARQGDVTYLARHFWLQAGGDDASFPADTMARAETHPWPGNVRELRELVIKLMVPGADAGLPCPVAPHLPGDDLARLAAVFEELLEADLSYTEARRRLLVQFEQRYVERMLIAHQGNVTRAAAASGLARRNFQLIRARRRDEV